MVDLENRTPPARAGLRRLMMALVVAEIVFMFFGARACAGQSAPIALSRAEALARAAAQHPTLRLAAADVQRAGGEYLAARGVTANRVVPDIAVSVTYQRQVQNQFDAIARRYGLTVPISDDPLTTVFNARNSLVATAQGTLVPFDGGVGAARATAARLQLAQATMGALSAGARLELDVITAYADAQLALRVQAIADSTIAQADRALAVARTAVAQGRAPEFDVVRAATARAAQLPLVAQAATARTLADVRLHQLAGIPLEVPLLLDTLPAVPPHVQADTLHPSDPLAVRQADLAVGAERALLSAARRARLPVLTLTATHQRSAFPSSGGLGWTTFFPNTSLAVQLSLPIDLTGRLRGAIQAATGALAAAEARAALVRQQQIYLRAEAEALRTEALASWQSGVAASTQAGEAFRIAEARYAAGRSSALELQDARLQLAAAQLAQVRAARDWTVTDARLARLSRLATDGSQP